MNSILSPISVPSVPGCEVRQGQAATPAPYTLAQLVADIKLHLGKEGGIDSSDVDEAYLVSLARKYNSNPSDWAQYYYSQPGKHYTRNSIEDINHKANILLLVWSPGKGSLIHDHAGAHCIMKVLAGKLTETVYYNNNNNGVVDKEDADATPLRVKSERTHSLNEVAYISDTIGLHRVHNPDPDNVAVSLHLYTPPHAADIGYHVFDETTGSSTFVRQAKALSMAEKMGIKA